MSDRSAVSSSANSAIAFRSILSAMARPGRVLDFASDSDVPPPLHRSTAAVATTLCDFQSPIWLSPRFCSPDVQHFLRFHTGAPIVAHPAEAAFAIADAASPIPDLAAFAIGTHEYPDRSTTLLIQVLELPGEPSVELSGPGLERPTRFGVAPLKADFWQQMERNNLSFPLGIDVIFVSASAIAACPRSTAIRILETV